MNENNNAEPALYVVGARGYSAYEIAVQNGFVGTEQEWLDSLVGPEGDLGPEGKSAYQVAVDNGYEGTEEQWVNDFLSPDGYYNKTEINQFLDNKISKDDIIDNLSTDNPNKVLSAKQGKLLKDNLDIIDGDLDNAKESISNEILDREEADNVLSQQIASLSSGSPLVASSISEMINTSKTYVNTTDGHWYYYNGNDWTDGGIYQATEISNKSIDILKIDDLLEQNFTREYANIDLGVAITGHYKKVLNGAIDDVTSSSYIYYDVTLDNNTIYEFSGFNNFSVPGIIVYDTEDDSIVTYTPITNSSTRFENVKLVFKTNKAGLKAYINNRASYSITTPFESILLIGLSKITAITQNKNENYIDKLREIDGYMFSITETTTDIDTLKIGSNQYGKINLYKLSKGTKYYVSSANLYNYPGIVIFNDKWQVLYKSMNSSAGSSAISVEYEFVATDNGYAGLIDFNLSPNVYDHSINIVKEENKYKSKKWALLGDSLTDDNVNTNVKKYYSYIQDDLGINIQNLGQSGCGYKRKFNNGNNFVEQSLLLDSDVDVVTIFGSFNDNHHFDVMGTVNDNTTNTLLGCVNVTINNIIEHNSNAKIGIIIPTPWSGYNPKTNLSSDARTYLDGIRTIAKNNSIPILDLFYESNLYPWLSSFRALYYVNSDGVHPNSEGNKRFAYQIEDFIKRLI